MTESKRGSSEPLDERRRQDFLAAHDGWVIEDETLTKTFTHDSFAVAIGFVAAVGVIAEQAFHHPDIDIRYSRVTISLTTHEAGGLTAKDTDLATAIEALG